MTFRRTLLSLAFPVLSFIVAGCNPPVDDAGKGGAAPAVTDPGKTVTHEPTSTDAKPKEGAMTAEPGAATAPVAPATDKPAEAPKADGPAMEPPK